MAKNLLNFIQWPSTIDQEGCKTTRREAGLAIERVMTGKLGDILKSCVVFSDEGK